MEPIPKLGGVGIDVGLLVVTRRLSYMYQGGSATAPNALHRFCSRVIVLTLQLNRCATYNDVSTFDVKIQPPTGLVLFRQTMRRGML